MTNPVTFYDDSDLYKQCDGLVDGKEFAKESEVIDFAIRLYYYQIKIKGFQPRQIKHDHGIKKSIRINQYLVDYLIDTSILKKGEIADYALDYPLQCRIKFNTEGNFFE